MIFHFCNTKLLNLRETSVSFFVLQVESGERLPFDTDALNGGLLSPLGARPSPEEE